MEYANRVPGAAAFARLGMVVAEKVGSGLRPLALLLVAASTLYATNYYVVVAGLGGTPEYDKQFSDWATEVDKALRTNKAAHVDTFSGNKATKQQLDQALARLNNEMKPDDTFALILMGHGTFDGEDYKFNVPGPDITAAQLSSWLQKVPAQKQLIVNMTSASGACLTSLAKKGRIVITATKSGNEKNLTVFPRYWLDALRDPAADADKNGAVSALEAFTYTQRKTANYFESAKLLASEHPMLSDTGAKDGVRDPSPANGQGLLAASFPVMQSGTEIAKTAQPEKQKLLAKKEALETEIDKLKYQKAAIAPDDYKKQLSTLLLELARTQAEIDR